MARTLHDVRPGAGFSFDSEAGALLANPNLAVLVARIIATWSLVESNLGLAAVSLLATKARAALAIYVQLQETSAQYAALYTAAREMLPSDDAELFCAAVRAARKLGKVRHLLAHGLIGEARGVEGLVIVEQRDLGALQAGTFFGRKGAAVRSLTTEFAKRALVFDSVALEAGLQDAQEASRIALYASIIASPGHHRADEARSHLRADPRVNENSRS